MLHGTINEQENYSRKKNSFHMFSYKTPASGGLILKAPSAIKSSAFLVCRNTKEASMASSVDPAQSAIGVVCSGSTLFASMLKFTSNVWHLFAADDVFRFIFLGALRVNLISPSTYIINFFFTFFLIRI